MAIGGNMGTRRLTRLANAKINLFLEVVGKRPDGYHDIETVMAEVDLADRLTVESMSEDGVELVCDDPALPVDGRNLVVKAAEIMRREYGGGRGGLRFWLEKRIPVGGGFGGGSSDAAAAILLIDELWGLGLSAVQLGKLGERVGMDVPFFCYGGGVRVCAGRGERVGENIRNINNNIYLGVACSGIFSGTAEAYAGLRLGGEVKRTDAMVQALRSGGDIECEVFNRFEETVFERLEALKVLRYELETLLGRQVYLSGSGSGMWFFVRELGFSEEIKEWGKKRGVELVAVKVMKALH